jgi:hypothetical protein
MFDIDFPPCVVVKFGSEFNCERYLTSGWADPNFNGVYNNALKAVITFPRPLAFANWALRFTLFPTTTEKGTATVVRISIDGSIAGILTIRSDMVYETFVGNLSRSISETFLIEFDFFNIAWIKESGNQSSLSTAGLRRLDLLMVSGAESVLKIEEKPFMQTFSERARIKKYFEEDVKNLNKCLEPFCPLPFMVEGYIGGVGASSGSVSVKAVAARIS